MNKRIFLPLFLILAGASGLHAFINVEPTATIEKAAAGGSFSGGIKVTNSSISPVKVTTKIQDWRYQGPNGVKTFLAAGTTDFSCSKLMTLSPAEFTLQPKETKTVNYSLSFPANSAGSYVTMVDFMGIETESERKNKDGVKIKVALHMGSFFEFEIKGTEKPRAIIKKFEPVNLAVDRPFEVAVRMKNEGNIRVEAKGRLSILDSRGSAMGWTDIPVIKTLPGDEWEVKTPWDAPLASGKYKMIATFELSSGGFLIKEKEIVLP